MQALPSVQDAVLLAKTQPDAVLQLSEVQTLPSLQTSAPPGWHAPAAQTSPLVQALPSMHAAVLFAWTQPVPVSQLSVVHGLLSLQDRAEPDWHEPPPQVSPVVQALPSLHATALLAWVQPVAVLHASSVHTLLSSHEMAEPDWHEPPPQPSPLVQALPSLQASVLLA